jgi:hypothetical protein
MTVGSGCGKKSSVASATSPASVSDLALSSALKITVSDKMATATGGSTSLALADFSLTAKKSREACQTMEETGRILAQLSMIISMFCHFEAESAQLG